jgi:hypothetical protein
MYRKIRFYADQLWLIDFRVITIMLADEN